MNIKPLGKRITLTPIDLEPTQTDVYVPEESKKKIARGKVLAIGDEVTKVKVGEICFFSPFHYDEITEDVIVVEEQDVWGIEE